MGTSRQKLLEQCVTGLLEQCDRQKLLVPWRNRLRALAAASPSRPPTAAPVEVPHHFGEVRRVRSPELNSPACVKKSILEGCVLQNVFLG